jgi:hypothetical protein
MIDKIDQIVNVKGSKVHLIIFFDEDISDRDLKYHTRIGYMLSKPPPNQRLSFDIRKAPEIRDRILRLFLQLAVSAFQSYPKIVELNNCMVQFRLTADHALKDTPAVYHRDVSDSNSAYISFNIEYLSQYLIIPQKGANKVRRILIHELNHHFDRATAQYELRLKKRLNKNPGEPLPFKTLIFINSMINLRSEGLARFQEKENVERIHIRVDRLVKFRREFQLSVKLKDINEYYPYYQGLEVYYIGMLMCFFIGLAFLREKQFHPIYLPGRMTASLEDLDQIMEKNKKFEIKNLPPEIFVKTMNRISKTKYRQFIRLYEWACDELKLSKRNRIIWWSLFDHWKKLATKYYEKHHKNEVKKAGFLAA